jgi:stage V sporulation protein G
MNMQVTEVRIRRTKKASVKAHAIICFDNCFLVRELKVIQRRPAGLSVSFPVKQLSDGTHWDIAFPLYAETRTMIEQAVLAEYEKVVAGSGAVPRETK